MIIVRVLNVFDCLLEVKSIIVFKAEDFLSIEQHNNKHSSLIDSYTYDVSI